MPGVRDDDPLVGCAPGGGMRGAWRVAFILRCLLRDTCFGHAPVVSRLSM